MKINERSDGKIELHWIVDHGFVIDKDSLAKFVTEIYCGSFNKYLPDHLKFGE